MFFGFITSSKTNTKMLLITQMLEPTDQLGALPYSGEEKR